MAEGFLFSCKIGAVGGGREGCSKDVNTKKRERADRRDTIRNLVLALGMDVSPTIFFCERKRENAVRFVVP